MICEEVVQMLQVEESELKLPLSLGNSVSARKRSLNQAKRLNLKTAQIYRAKSLRLLKKDVNDDGELNFYRHPNRIN